MNRYRQARQWCVNIGLSLAGRIEPGVKNKFGSERVKLCFLLRGAFCVAASLAASLAVCLAGSVEIAIF